MKYIIFSKFTNKVLYGFNSKTLVFSTYEIAYEVAIQFFEKESDFTIIEVNF